MKITLAIKHLLLCPLLIISAATASAQTTTDADICKEEQRLLTSLEQELETLEKISSRIDALTAGAAPETLTIEKLIQLLSNNNNEVTLTTWPEEIHCTQLQTTYNKARKSLTWNINHLRHVRKTHWQDQPEAVRDSILSVWRSRQRLLQHEQLLLNLLTDIDAETVLNDIDKVQALLREQRLTFLELLPTLRGDITGKTIEPWIKLWRQSLTFSWNFQPLPEEQLQAFSPALKAAINDHYRIAQLDHLVMANAFNTIRGWLWKYHSNAFQQPLALNQSNTQQLLADELLAFRTILFWLYVDATVDFREAGEGNSAIIWRFFQGFGYLFGLLSFALLAWVTGKIKAPAVALQANYARRNRKNRMHAQISRITSGIPIFLPWLVGWLGLSLLEALFKNNHLTLLLPLIPFAKLYIIYGIMRHLGEWFCFRIAQQAGAFLNEQQLKLINIRARDSARIFILPWLLQSLTALAIGPSLTLEMLDVLTLITLLIAIGVLLKPLQREFILALQSFLPPALDVVSERVFSKSIFVFLAPLVTPILLIALLINFINKGLMDFDWYRKLVARSFKLRSGTQDSEEVTGSDQNALANYQHWFMASVDDNDVPFINTGLADIINTSLEPWLGGRSEENTLLLSGERGSGKSSAISRLRKDLQEEHSEILVHYLEVPAKTTTAESVHYLLGTALGIDLSEGPGALVISDEQRQPTIVILEDAQNFFLREVGGLAGWETLLSLTHARLSNIFWVIAINNQSWAFLSNVFGRDYQFSTVLKTRAWSQNDIRSLILSRNQLSGFQIRYDNILLSTRGPEAGSIRNAEQLYFSLLWDACRGNPLLALHMWLTSITVKGKIVTVGLPAEVSGAAIERLGEEVHFVYAALVLHENMTSDELVTVTAIAQGVVRSALKIAFDAGFVERSPNRRYRIVPLWYPTITKILARKNLLHE